MLQMLQIGVAVGDIEKVERNAYLQKTGLQVTYSQSQNMLYICYFCLPFSVVK